MVVVLSSEMVYFVGRTDPISIVLKVTLKELARACSVPFGKITWHCHIEQRPEYSLQRFPDFRLN